MLLFWVYLVGIDLLLIDGGGGFDRENVKFAWLLLINLFLFWVQPTLLVYFIYFFVFMDLMEIMAASNHFRKCFSVNASVWLRMGNKFFGKYF